MQYFKPNLNLKNPFIRYRWWVFVLLVFGIGLFEHYEHPGTFLENPLLTEIILFSILFGAAFFFSESLLKAISARDKLLREVEFRDKLILQLSLAKDWDEFCQRLLDFPRSLARINEEYLLVYRDQDSKFALEASWPPEIIETDKIVEIQNNCSLCLEDRTSRQAILISCARLRSVASPGVHCLMLRYANKVIGILQFSTEDPTPLSEEVCENLERASIVTAPVLEAFSQKREATAAKIVDATRAERLAISQDMHDTIGQNLCYLRLKLDQFSSPGGLRKVGDVRQEMEQLRDTANESYELVRGALAILHLENSPQFVDLLRAQGVMVAERAGFEFMLDSVGEIVPLAPEVMRHAFFACKEALTNIENHAQAKNVVIELHWNDVGLEVTVVDDGIGFDPVQTRPLGHFGLEIMKKRIESVEGCFIITSTLNVGTDVKFWVPYTKEIQPSMERPA